MLDMTYISHS